MIAYLKKYVLILCALFTCQQTIGMADYAQRAWREMTATNERKVLTALAALCLGNELYRYVCITLQKNVLAMLLNQQNRTPHKRKPTITLFGHGLKATQEQGNEYKNILNREEHFEVFNFPYAGADVRKLSDLITMSKCSLAQESDIKTWRKQINKHTNKNINIFAISTAASAALCAVAIDRPTNVQSIIVESPFDDVKSVVAGIASYASLIPGVTTLGNIAASLIFPRYSTGNLRPIDVVTYIPDEIPVLFICSRQDRLVPAWSTKRLYTTLKEHRAQRGIHNVYLREANQGKHGEILKHNQEWYQAAVNGAYKKAHIPLE
ncbi:MAG: hypothetical protein ACHQVS_01815 [Candidatus Babeliales bacterium]